MRIFRFVKDCTINGHVYEAGRQIELFRNFVSMDGGILTEPYQTIFKNFLMKEIERPEYIKEEFHQSNEF